VDDETDPAAESDKGLLSSSAGHLYQLFRQGRVRTRGELRELTNLSRSTVTPRVDALLAAGFLREQGATASTGGRRASVLVPHEEPKTLLVADLGATHGRLAVTDGAGAVLAQARLESRIDTGPEAVLERVFTTFRQLLADAGRDEARIDGIGIGVPGPVDVRAATVVQPPIMPGWHGFDIRGFGARYFAAPIFVANDANLMALGESRRIYPHTPSLLFVKVATGIGAGLVLRGTIYDGVDGGAGDIGHVRVPEAAVCATAARTAAWPLSPAARRWPARSPNEGSRRTAAGTWCGWSSTARRRPWPSPGRRAGSWGRCWRPRSACSTRRCWSWAGTWPARTSTSSWACARRCIRARSRWRPAA